MEEIIKGEEPAGQKQEPGMGKALVIEPEKCTGCNVCELICSSFHFGEYNPSRAHIKVLKNKEMCVFVPALGVGCDLCNGQEMCARWCPEKVLTFITWEEAARQRKQMKMGRFPTVFISE